MPYMLNTDELNWGAKMGFFWAGLTALCALWCASVALARPLSPS